MKRFKRLGISLTIAFFAVCCGAILLFNWQITGWKALTVPTGSMRPTIPPGSLVLMHSVPISTLKVGDVITYTNPSTMKTTVTHRIIKAYKLNGKIPAYITKGDANKSADPWTVVGGLVKGKEVFHMPYVGSWLAWTKKPVGILAMVYIPAFLLMFEEVQRLNVYYRQSRAYKSAVVLARERRKSEPKPRLAMATTISVALIAIPVVFAFPAYALLRSNTVSLAPNNLTVVAKVTPPPPQCTTNGNSTTITVNGNSNSSNNVNVNNSNNQSASTGNASSSGNTNGGSATSGNASNTNCTSININIH